MRVEAQFGAVFVYLVGKTSPRTRTHKVHPSRFKVHEWGEGSIHTAKYLVQPSDDQLLFGSVQFNNHELGVRTNGSGYYASNIATELISHQKSARETTDYQKMPYHSEFLTKDEMGLEAPDPLTLYCQRDLNLRLRISCSFARSCADHRRAFSSYFWIRRTRLAVEDGCPTGAVHVPATKVCEYTAAHKTSYYDQQKYWFTVQVVGFDTSRILHNCEQSINSDNPDQWGTWTIYPMRPQEHMQKVIQITKR